MIMGNPPRMLTAEAVTDAGVGAVFVNPHGEVLQSMQGNDGHLYLAIMVQSQMVSGVPYRAPYRLSDVLTDTGPRSSLARRAPVGVQAMTVKHGTYAGWNWHRRTGNLPVCLDCREAARQYKARRRANVPESYRTEKDQNSARSRALFRLKRAHEDEFQALYEEEIAKSIKGLRS